MAMPVIDDPDALEVIREENGSTADSSIKINQSLKEQTEDQRNDIHLCSCGENDASPCRRTEDLNINTGISPEEVQQILRKREEEMNKQFEVRLKDEVEDLKSKFDFVLQNEQVRTSYMLREAQRDRQEKITALEAQLECKNLAGLMFVMCAERRKSKLENLRMKQEYTSYIQALQSILTDGQDLILHLSRGYKTAARVDEEWRQKMRTIISEFQAYIYHFCGGEQYTNQYLFDMATLMKTEASIADDPHEDPCEEDDKEVSVEAVTEADMEKPWYERLDEECRPFVMMGDMAEFRPPQRRQVLGAVKAAKTAPRRWKEYVFNEMFLRADCKNADVIKDEYPKRLPTGEQWECMGVQTERDQSCMSAMSPPRRFTTPSIDVRGNMGFILKIISSSDRKPHAKATLLGARDSMEIASTTKLREKHRQSEPGRVVINVGNRRESLINQLDQTSCKDEGTSGKKKENIDTTNDNDEEVDVSLTGIVPNDSVEAIANHIPEKDSKLNYEKVCPMEKCQRMQMDSFVRSLPPYMRASPFLHYEQTYEDYETCSPEQLEILRQRIESKRKKDYSQNVLRTSPTAEWEVDSGQEGVKVQTSQESLLPPCTCIGPSPTPVSSDGNIYNVADLYPVKKLLNEIRRECFFDSDINFDRFKVIGQESSHESLSVPREENFTKRRLSQIQKILKRHPSLYEMFQANTQC